MAVEASWHEHYLDEMDAAYLYRALARVEPDARRRTVFERLAKVEDEHVDRWRALFHSNDTEPPAFSPSRRSRLLAWVAGRFGSSLVLPLVLAEETREIGAYLKLANRARQKAEHDTAVAIASESAAHAQELSETLGREGEPWHRTAGSGYLRSVVYGFNDGLTANFGLVAGVIGASVQPHLVIVTGIAGALADALSMGSSGYLAAKSTAEVAARQIALEREEIRLMPDLEEEELTLIYEAKGLSPARARETAKTVMRDPHRALETQIQEELGIQEPAVSPLADGVTTGIATAIGALIPLVPFLLLPAQVALWVSLTASMLAHFGVGAARSAFTGRGILVSGRDMFLIGFGVAAIGYIIGDLLVKF
jgi:VIT1/CCC1 family predicted Fe2+/Mn2+ transporter/rubrerythrin